LAQVFFSLPFSVKADNLQHIHALNTN